MNYDYGKFRLLCEAKSVTPTEVARATGIPRSTLSDWKQGKYEPKVDKIRKILNYFVVDESYLLNNSERKQGFIIGKKNNKSYVSPEVDLLAAFNGNKTKMYKFILKLQKSPSLKHLIELSSNAKDKDIEVVNVVLNRLINDKISGE